MPGIVGVITKAPRATAQAELNNMLAELCHEPSYVCGKWESEDLGVYVGWTARKGSFAAEMPVHNENRHVHLVFSGEEYSDQSTISNLRQRGHTFDTSGPEYLVHLYEEERQFPKGLNGRFQGILIDEERKSVFLFNDRFGLHRIYYHDAGDSFYFAAEAKAILAVRAELRSIDARSLGELISCGCVMENRTLFDGIYLIPAGSAWRFENCLLSERRTYFQAEEWENQDPLNAEEYYQALRGAFSRILPRYFQGREPIGMSLTGGLDTRMIMAWQRCPPGSLPCYSFGGTFRDCQDVILARRIAALCEQSHQVITVDGNLLSNFARYAERAIFLTDGCVGVSRACDLYVNECAAEIAPVRITGNYGSEILRRLRAFKPVDSIQGLFVPEIEKQIAVARRTYAKYTDLNAMSFIAFCQLPWHHFGNLALEETQVTMRSPFVDNEMVQTAFRAPDTGVVKSDIFVDSKDCIRLIRDGDKRLKSIPTDRGLNGGSALSRALLEFSFKAEYAYDYGMPNALARIDHLFSPLHFERIFLGRHKFTHFRIWYRDYLSDYVRDMLLDSRSLSRSYLNRRKVDEIVDGHLSGKQNFTTEIHRLLSLEYVHRLFIDRP